MKKNTRTSKPQRITTLNELKDFAKQQLLFVHIRLGGTVRSSKAICWEGIGRDRPWTVYNDIDGTEQYLNDKELAAYTNIIKAMDAGCLFKD